MRSGRDAHRSRAAGQPFRRPAVGARAEWVVSACAHHPSRGHGADCANVIRLVGSLLSLSLCPERASALHVLKGRRREGSDEQL
eukprot:scaffold1594_cov401-Prasinococcus_capsulatus_cf.AAC.37